MSGIFIFDITNPFLPAYTDFIFTEILGDISPEGMVFINADDSPWGTAMLAVANEISGTTTLYQLQHTVPEPATLVLLILGIVAIGGLRCGKLNYNNSNGLPSSPT